MTYVICAFDLAKAIAAEKRRQAAAGPEAKAIAGNQGGQAEGKETR